MEENLRPRLDGERSTLRDAKRVEHHVGTLGGQCPVGSYRLLAQSCHILTVGLHSHHLVHSVGHKFQLIGREGRHVAALFRQIALYENIDRILGADLYVMELRAANTIDIDLKTCVRVAKSDRGYVDPLLGFIVDQKAGGGGAKFGKDGVETYRVARKGQYVGR